MSVKLILENYISPVIYKVFIVKIFYKNKSEKIKTMLYTFFFFLTEAESYFVVAVIVRIILWTSQGDIKGLGYIDSFC